MSDYRNKYFQEKKNAPGNTNGENKPTKKDKKENLKKAEVKNGTDTNHSLHNLSQQLDVAEEAQVLGSHQVGKFIPCAGSAQSRPAAYDSREIGNSKPTRCCERRTGSAPGGIQKLVPLFKVVEMLTQATVEQLTKEKWELSAANADLQQRLQQTVTMAHMQVGTVMQHIAALSPILHAVGRQW